MARRRKAERRVVAPDPKYNSDLVARVINTVLRRGKKSKAEGIVYGALGRIGEKMGEDPLAVLVKAVDSAKPRVEVKSRRVGGATYQVPVEVSSDRQQSLAIRWLVQFARARKGVAMEQALALEIMDACGGQGGAVKKREDTYRMAQANRAFAHYAW